MGPSGILARVERCYPTARCSNSRSMLVLYTQLVQLERQVIPNGYQYQEDLGLTVQRNRKQS